MNAVCDSFVWKVNFSSLLKKGVFQQAAGYQNQSRTMTLSPQETCVTVENKAQF
jgi:hypothetical protein